MRTDKFCLEIYNQNPEYLARRCNPKMHVADTLQLAEEASELSEVASRLAKSALKLLRTEGLGNITPTTPREACAELADEFADVLALMFVMSESGRFWDFDIAEAISTSLTKKEVRYLERIHEHEAKENQPE